jgi:Fe-S-cluster-containing hydrogenase component 2
MPKRIALRLLAVALILSVGLFAMQAAGHWHGHSSDEQHCQVCHTGHVAVAQPAAQIKTQSPVTVARFAVSQDQKLSLDPVCSHRIPRAPPV